MELSKGDALPTTGLRYNPMGEHADVLDSMSLGMSQSMQRTRALACNRDEREAETRAWSRKRFERHYKTAELFAELQPDFAEARGIKIMYPRGWSEIEDPSDPHELRPHCRNLRPSAPAEHVGNSVSVRSVFDAGCSAAGCISPGTPSKSHSSPSLARSSTESVGRSAALTAVGLVAAAPVSVRRQAAAQRRLEHLFPPNVWRRG
eukprot:TRINITY_DN49194_c0_g1_i1.p1 TRINITY_DN49194_c0_g1~~TRINITY_DN49194_c0_g1_i1.p1  ORF type:complete len:205 (-),score=16.95 TRINITY_DN49194_c0_g1_i1:291-905(-)